MYRNKKDAKSKSKVDTCPDNLDKRDRSKYKSNVDDTNTNNTNTNKKNDYNNESDNNNNATNKADEKEKEEKDVIIDVKSSGTHEIETSYQSTVSVSASSSPFRAEYRLASASFRGTASRTSRSSSPPPPSLFTIMSFLSASIFGTSSRYRTIRNTDDNTHSSSSLNHHNTNNVYSRHKAEKKNEFLVDALIKVVCVSIFLFSVGLLVHFVYVTLPALSANSYLAPNASAVFSPGTLIGPAAALASDSRTSTHSSSSTSSRSDSAHSTSLSEAGIAEATCTQNGFLYPPDLRGTWQSVDSEGVHGYFSISERNDKITTKLATIPSVAHSSSHRRELTREDSIATLSSTTASTSPPLPTSLSYSSLLTNSVDTVVFDHLPEFAVPATNAYITQFGGNGDFVDTSVNANYNEALQRRRQQLLTFYKVEECAVVDNKVYQRCMLVRLNPLAPSSSSPSLSVFVYSDAKLQHKCPTIDTGSAALDQSLMMGVG